MADRSIAVRVTVDIRDLQAGMQDASRAVKDAELSIMGAARTYKQEMTTIGIAAAGAGLAIAAGVGMGVKAAIDWESAFAGVRKTVDGTVQELAYLEDGLRSLTQEIPVSHAELAGIGEAAGQLGIQTGNVLKFTETMAALGVTTNLTSEQAATMFARFANITGLPQDQIENLGSTVVDLGNNLATTEAEIGDMALRIAGAGAQIGLTDAEILGFAGALSSVGIESQAGGTAISRVFVEIDKAVRAGDDSLDRFAGTAGMTADQFTRAYQQDAAGAIVSFVEGLDSISESGGNVFGVLEDLELGDIRVRDALLRAAGAGDLFRDSIARGTEAFEDNTALSKVAALRYETTASQIQLAQNALYDMGITIGEVVLPVLLPLLEGASELLHWFSDLPDPIQNTAVALGIAGAALLTIGGTLLIVLPRIAQTIDAWKKLQAAMAAAQATSAVGVPGGAAGGLRGTLNSSTMLKGAVYVGAGIAVTQAVTAGIGVANQMEEGQAALADRVASLILAAERGDQAAAEKLQDFRDTMVDNRSWWDRNSPTGLGFQASRILDQAEDIAQQRRLEDWANQASRLDTVVSAAVGTVGGIPVVTEAVWNYAAALDGAAEAQMGLITAMNLAFSESGRAIAAIANMDAAAARLAEVEADPESTIEDIAAAQFAYAESVFAAQGAIDAMTTDSLEQTIDGLSEALGIGRDTAIELLDTLGLLDGKEVNTIIRLGVSDLGSVVGAAFGTVGGVPAATTTNRFAPIERRAAGGPMVGGSIYQVGEGNRPELYAGPGGLYMVPGDTGRMFTMDDIAGGDTTTLIFKIDARGATDPEAVGRAVTRRVSRDLNIYKGGAKRLLVD
jgi:TP901 family phage tail tape measure protein